MDAFAVKLDGDGNRIWHTFMGSGLADYGADYGDAIAVDDSYNVYVTGYSYVTWGAPVNNHSGGVVYCDAFAAMLDVDGNRIWHTFMGAGSSNDYGKAIAIDGSRNIYVAGNSQATWGTPIDTYTGGSEAFVAQLDNSGNRIWNTFIGSAASDYARDIATNGSNFIYVSGYSDGTWGNPLNVYNGGGDGFAAQFSTSGNRIWNTFIGSAHTDYADSLALYDNNNLINVIGYSYLTWGTPINPHAGGYESFVAQLGREIVLPTITVEWANNTQTVSEDVGAVTITAELSAISAFDVTVPFTVSGTADTSDHDLIDGSILIPAGNLTGAELFNIVDDADMESDETVVVNMGTPTNAVLGTTSVQTITVTDNDLTCTYSLDYSYGVFDSPGGSGSIMVVASDGKLLMAGNKQFRLDYDHERYRSFGRRNGSIYG